MKIAINYMLGLSLVALTTISCSDSSDSATTPSPSIENPKIKFITPVEGTVIDAGDSITIIADLTHSADIHEYGVRVSTGTTIYLERTFHTHTDSLRLVLGWKAPDNLSHTEIKIEVEATDHDNRKGAAEVNLHIHG